MVEEYLILEEQTPLGIQKIYKFENGYGASVVKHHHSYGNKQDLWEMALLTFGYSDDDELLWKITYRDWFAHGDVAGYLDDQEVLEHLKWIQSIQVA